VSNTTKITKLRRVFPDAASWRAELQ